MQKNWLSYDEQLDLPHDVVCGSRMRALLLKFCLV